MEVGSSPGNPSSTHGRREDLQHLHSPLLPSFIRLQSVFNGASESIRKKKKEQLSLLKDMRVGRDVTARDSHRFQASVTAGLRLQSQRDLSPPWDTMPGCGEGARGQGARRGRDKGPTSLPHHQNTEPSVNTMLPAPEGGIQAYGRLFFFEMQKCASRRRGEPTVRFTGCRSGDRCSSVPRKQFRA